MDGQLDVLVGDDTGKALRDPVQLDDRFPSRRGTRGRARLPVR
jgi:hypothetical protein